MTRLLWISLICSALFSCANTQDTSPSDHKAICKELKRRIVFNAATPDNTSATQQRAEMKTLNSNFNTDGC